MAYRKPDLNAPRFRPESYHVLNNKLFERFIRENPKYEGLIDLKTFKLIIYAVNGKICETVMDNRDGVELPEQLGNIFIGSCPRMDGGNPDHKLSAQYNQVIQNKNWESDGLVAKIFYTNFETKYRFRNHELWGFEAVRQFKRSVSNHYRTEFRKYMIVDGKTQVSRLFRSEKYVRRKAFLLEKALEEYDEFNFN